MTVNLDSVPCVMGYLLRMNVARIEKEVDALRKSSTH